jgi:hypothetical protein
MLCASNIAYAQRPNVIQGIGSRIGNIANSGGGGSTGDSLRNRSKEEDSISTRIYFIDSTWAYRFDSSIIDFTIRFPIPWHHQFIGNTGSATKSLLFNPRMKAGFDPGFHAFDVYKWNIDQVRFYNTTRPYTELGYIIGGRSEQIIDVMHTQNIRPYWNFSFQYRLINAPGLFRNQQTNHNNYLFSSWYQSPNKRYNNYFAIVANKLQAGESGGIKSDQDYINNPIYTQDPFAIPSNIGGDPSYSRDFFSTQIGTGNRYNETSVLMRHQYDLGKKDSIVTDSTVIPLFYPRARFEHTFKYGKYSYNFIDMPGVGRSQNVPDSVFYDSVYNIKFLTSNPGVSIQDQWKEVTNDFSIYQFPDANNLHQFIKVGAEIQLLSGQVRSAQSLYNLTAHGAYRNRTRNQKWDINASGRLFLNGYNAGDYHAYAELQRLNSRIGNFQVGFENINRTPSYIFDRSSSFYLATPQSFSKENIVHISGSYFQPKFKVYLRGDYYLITNYLYFKNYYQPQQESSPFNVLRLSASKTFTFFRRIRWYADLFLQQPTGDVEINMPVLFTRNRIGYEGNLGFRNLNIFFGTEIRYHTPYKADNYSPVLGQFFYQNQFTLYNFPQVDAFLHLRIRGFRAFWRFDNLNVPILGYNFAAPFYPMPGGLMRLGIHWSFVN